MADKMGLEDLGFRYVNPEKYREIAQNLAERRSVREQEMQGIKEKLEEVLSQAGIQADVPRGQSILFHLSKMVRKGVPFELVMMFEVCVFLFQIHRPVTLHWDLSMLSGVRSLVNR